MDEAQSVQIPVPWERESGLTRRLLHDGAVNGKARFHYLDVWHCLHLGVGKSFIASGVMLLQKLIPESNMDKRLAVISDGYLMFCKRNKLDPVIRKLDIFTFGGIGDKERNGTWNKAAVTSNLLMYLEDFCTEKAELIQGDENLRIFASGQHELNLCFGHMELFARFFLRDNL